MAAIFQQTEIVTMNTNGVVDKLDDLMDMHKDTSRFDEIRHEIARLREQMIAFGSSKQQHRQELLEQSHSYAQALLDSLELPPGYDDSLSMTHLPSHRFDI